jgi:hypothetical protein
LPAHIAAALAHKAHHQANEAHQRGELEPHPLLKFGMPPTVEPAISNYERARRAKAAAKKRQPAKPGRKPATNITGR